MRLEVLARGASLRRKRDLYVMEKERDFYDFFVALILQLIGGLTRESYTRSPTHLSSSLRV